MFNKFGSELRMVDDFVFIRAGDKGENYHVRIMFRGKEVTASNLDGGGYPVC